VGAVGFCYGGWAVFRLGDRAYNNDNEEKTTKLVDCISTAHPSWLEKEEIEKVGVPVQILAPEIDPVFTPELKEFSNRVIPALGVPYDYQYFPGLEHAFATRGDPAKEGERRGMERAKNGVVNWMREWLHVQD
jgi:dienelactone hydrolase